MRLQPSPKISASRCPRPWWRWRRCPNSQRRWSTQLWPASSSAQKPSTTPSHPQRIRRKSWARSASFSITCCGSSATQTGPSSHRRRRNSNITPARFATRTRWNPTLFWSRCCAADGRPSGARRALRSLVIAHRHSLSSAEEKIGRGISCEIQRGSCNPERLRLDLFFDIVIWLLGFFSFGWWFPFDPVGHPYSSRSVK